MCSVTDQEPDKTTKPTDLPSVLIVDDEQSIRSLLVTALELTEEYEVLEAATGDEARQILSQRPVDVAVTDLIMPGQSGLELLEWAQGELPGTTWIILSGKGTFDDAVQAVHLGAFDFICKPLPAVDSLVVTIRNALRQRRLEEERDRLHLDIEERNMRLREQVSQLREACKLLGQQAQIINDDLRRAELIQRALLPRVPPDTGPFSVNALYRPSQSVGGDIYECLRMDYRYVLGYVADAAGHGVSAAMLAVLYKHRLHMVDETTGQPTDPARILEMVNRDLIGECRAPGLFVTACYFILDIEDSVLTLASAGHPAALIQRADGHVESLYHTGPALGITSGAHFAQKRFELDQGDRFLLYTDGLFDPGAQDRAGLTPRKLAEDLAQNRDQAGQNLLRKYLLQVSGQDDREHLDDDVTMLLIGRDSHASVLDNGNETPPQQQRELPGGDESAVLVGGDDEQRFMCVEGRATWTHSTGFHQVCKEAIETGREVVLDLSTCTYMDSTFMGTILELVELANQAGTDIRIQGLLEDVEEQLVELGMDSVRREVTPEVQALPTDMAPLEASNMMAQDDGLRMLRAHEALSGLNDKNRGEFLKLIEGLRQELATGD
jgi:serine phosphatase RsbU (regulator of sigma subunit)/anti-anti-sigma regulatory factor